MNQKLTVIIPVYNVIGYLGQCVASVQAQQYRDYEIILVDDGSTDGSGALCDTLAAADPRIRVIHKANAGAGMARNTGLDAATGKYVAFLDSDDTIHPAAYSDCIRAMADSDARQARFMDQHFTDACPPAAIDTTTPATVFRGREAMRNLAKTIFGRPYPADNAYNIGGSACMAVYSLDLIRKGNLRFYSERELVSEDFLFNYRYYLLSDSLVWLPRPYYNYRVVEGSLTHSNHLDKMERVEKYSRFVKDMMQQDGFGADAGVYAAAYCVMMLRVCAKYVLTDPALTSARKRAWFDRYIRSGYYRSHCRRYPSANLTLPQRLLQAAFRRGSYPAALLMARAHRALKG